MVPSTRRVFTSPWFEEGPEFIGSAFVRRHSRGHLNGPAIWGTSGATRARVGYSIAQITRHRDALGGRRTHSVTPRLASEPPAPGSVESDVSSGGIQTTGTVGLVTVQNEVLVSVDVPRPTAVEIWANDECEPDVVCLLFGAAPEVHSGSEWPRVRWLHLWQRSLRFLQVMFAESS